MIRRRAFVSLVGGAAAWPFAARAQQGEKVRRIGVLMNLAEDDPETRARVAAFQNALQGLGWIEGRNMRLEFRWGVGDPDRMRANVTELVALAPDVILAHGSPIMRPLKRATSTVPIVFLQVSDPVAAGFVASLARPGGNATGLLGREYALSVKWPELLKEIAPNVTRVAFLRDPDQMSASGQFGAIQAVAPSLRLELSAIDVRDPGETEQAIGAFARQPNGGLIGATSTLAQINRKAIVALAARYKLPAVYAHRIFVTSGGLVSYDSDPIDQYRRAAGFVDRILKGEKPADLPVQAPTKFELVLNLKTANLIGLPVPESVLLRAVRIIE